MTPHRFSPARCRLGVLGAAHGGFSMYFVTDAR